jgi:hypothetical protein
MRDLVLPLALLLVLAALGGYGMAYGLRWAAERIDPAYLPWTPLDLTARPNLWTPYKFLRLRQDPEACRAALANTGMSYRPMADRAGGECPLSDIVQVARAGVDFDNSFLSTCPLAAAWELYWRNSLQPLARERFGQEIAKVEHLGSFACRNIYGRATGRRSEHATANALDLAAFVLADGTRIAVARDWDSTTEPVKATFLREAHAGACRYFGAVLGPDYNAAHRDHFHLDMGRFGVCR